MEIGITQYMGEDTTLGNIQTKAFLCRVALVLQSVSYLTFGQVGSFYRGEETLEGQTTFVTTTSTFDMPHFYDTRFLHNL